jgi:hypothetical protein
MDHVYVSKAQRSSPTQRDALIALGIAVAVLTIAVIWLAAGRNQPAKSDAALKNRVALLEAQLTAAQQSAAQLAAGVSSELKAQAARLKKLAPARPSAAASVCLAQLQQEIDDLRGYVALGGAIRRRVSPQCTALLRPRFGG